jgi:hypothetical protein
VFSSEDPEPSALEDKPSFSIVSQADGTCFIKVVGLHAKAIVTGIFANEFAAQMWMGLLQGIDQISS